MTREEIEKLTEGEVLALMAANNLNVTHTPFDTDWLSGYELIRVSQEAHEADLARWRRELAEHFLGNG